MYLVIFWTFNGIYHFSKIIIKKIILWKYDKCHQKQGRRVEVQNLQIWRISFLLGQPTTWVLHIRTVRKLVFAYIGFIHQYLMTLSIPLSAALITIVLDTDQQIESIILDFYSVLCKINFWWNSFRNIWKQNGVCFMTRTLIELHKDLWSSMKLNCVRPNVTLLRAHFSYQWKDEIS